MNTIRSFLLRSPAARPFSSSSALKAENKFNIVNEVLINPSLDPEMPRPDINLENVPHQSLKQCIDAVCPTGHRLGIDICDVERVGNLIDTSYNKHLYRRFSSRVLTLIEIRLQKPEKIRRAEHLAGRWAAKEAIIKAMRGKADEESGRKTFMQDIVILPAHILEAVEISDPYRGTFTEKPGKSLQRAQGIKGPVRAFVRCGSDEGTDKWSEVIVSISHDGNNAIAVAFVEGASYANPKGDKPVVDDKCHKTNQ